jgi:hypothetical protein
MDTRRFQHFLGHASITNTERYTAMSPEPFKVTWPLFAFALQGEVARLYELLRQLPADPDGPRLKPKLLALAEFARALRRVTPELGFLTPATPFGSTVTPLLIQRGAPRQISSVDGRRLLFRLRLTVAHRI